MRCKFRLAAIAAAALLAACGGREDVASPAIVEVAAAPAANPFGDFSKAVPVNTTLSGTRLDHARAMAAAVKRKHALSAGAFAATSLSLTPSELFNWGQQILPALFPGNPPTMSGDYGGAMYDYRAYPAPGTKLGFTYLGVRRSDGAVFVLFSNDEAIQYGFIEDYLCDVKQCGSVNPVIAGNILLEITKHTLTPTLYNGKVLGNSKGELDPSTLDYICAEGPDYGFADSTTCGAYQGGRSEIAGVSNNSKVQYVGRLKGSGERVWFTIDQSATTHFTFSGLNARYVNGFIEYAEYLESGMVYRKPAVKTEGTNLVLAFGRNRLSGFNHPDGRRTDFSTGNYQFRFQPRSRSVEAVATPVWRDATKELVVEFKTNLRCSETGTITVHRQIISGGYSTGPVGYISIGRNLPATATTPAEPADIIWRFITPWVVPTVDPPFYGFTYFWC